MDKRWREELAWTAGFFDGEGSIQAIKWKREKRPRPLFSIGQTEPTTPERALRAFGFGTVGGPYPRPEGHKPFWVFRLTKHEEIQAAVAMMWKFLSRPKREQATRALAAMKEYYVARDKHRELRVVTCANGHTKNPDGSRSYGTLGRCRECDREAHRKYKLRHPGRGAQSSREYRARRKQIGAKLWEA